MITLYTTGCPRCVELKCMLDKKNIKYETVTDKEMMIEKGFMSVPVLDVHGETLIYKEAKEWVKARD